MEPRSALMAEMMGMVIVIMAILFLVGIFVMVCLWIIYSKAKQPGWAILIPIYNLIVLLKIVGRPVSWLAWVFQVIFFEFLFIFSQNIITLLLFVLSIITALVFNVIITNGLSKSFGKDAGFTVGLIFLPFVFYPLLAFGKAEYIGPGGVSQNDDPLL